MLKVLIHKEPLFGLFFILDKNLSLHYFVDLIKNRVENNTRSLIEWLSISRVIDLKLVFFDLFIIDLLQNLQY